MGAVLGATQGQGGDTRPANVVCICETKPRGSSGTSQPGQALEPPAQLPQLLLLCPHPLPLTCWSAMIPRLSGASASSVTLHRPTRASP